MGVQNTLPAKALAALLVAAVAYVFSDPRRRFWAAYSAEFLLGEYIPGLPEMVEAWGEFALGWAEVPRDSHVAPTPFLEIQKGEYSMEKFREVSDEFTRPVIVRGLFDGAPFMNWTAMSMADHFGPNRTFISLGENNVGAGKQDGGASWNPSPRTVPDVVRNLVGGGSNYIFNANFKYPDDLPMYDEIDLPGRMELSARSAPSLFGGGPLMEPSVIQFFVGMQRAHESRPAPGEKKRQGGSPLHAAATPNFNLQISGRKQWLMVAPENSHLVKPQMLGTQFATLAKAGQDDWEPYQERWNNVPRFQGEVGPGDGILIPPWFYHEVINQPGRGTEKCNCMVPGLCNGIDECADAWQLSVATRFIHTQASLRNNWLYAALTDLGVRDKPCFPGLRHVCIQLFMQPWKDGPIGAFVGGLNHSQSTAALEHNMVTQLGGATGATETTGERYE